MPTTNYVNYFTEALQIQSMEEEKKMNECPYSLQLQTILFLNIFRWSFCEVIRNLSLARLYLNLLNMVLHEDKQHWQRI